LIGLRGPRGGYQLAGDPSRITIADVAQVLARDHPVDVGAAPASALAQERLMPLWRRLESTVEHELNRVTIADLMITHEDRCAAD
jgi:DNA-binding IscR family transcriptional regulator